MAFLIGLECTGDRICAFPLELVQQSKVFVAFNASTFVKFKYKTIPHISHASFGLKPVDFMWLHDKAYE